MKKHLQHAQCVGLALGAGGARGFAHIGVLHALDEAGITISTVAGTSMGSLVGAFLAAHRIADLRQVALGLDWRGILTRYSDLSIRGGGLIEGKTFQRELGRLLHIKTFSELSLPFRAIATDMYTGSEVVMAEGDLPSAIRASCCIPGLLAPIKRDGHWLIDGSLVNPIPVNITRQLGADFVIAVDVPPAPELSTPGARTPGADSLESAAQSGLWQEISDAWNEPVSGRASPAAWMARVQNLFEALQDYTEEYRLRPRKSKTPGLLEVLTQSVRIAEARIAHERLQTEPPDLLIRPDVGMYSSLDFDRGAEIIMAGYLAARNALAEHRKHAPRSRRR